MYQLTLMTLAFCNVPEFFSQLYNFEGVQSGMQDFCFSQYQDCDLEVSFLMDIAFFVVAYAVVWVWNTSWILFICIPVTNGLDKG